MTLRGIYNRLHCTFGPQHWWPARTAFEMMVGAILTQATNWRNAERSIQQLEKAGLLSAKKLTRVRLIRLQRLIRPVGYFRQKASRLRGYAQWFLASYRGSARRMFKSPWPALRRQLLGLNGVGPETADSILLYAGSQPVFVVDAYTTRVFSRHGLLEPSATYDEVQELVMRSVPREVHVYQEFHALLVAVGKRYCHRHNPKCGECPLGDLPHTSSR